MKYEVCNITLLDNTISTVLFIIFCSIDHWAMILKWNSVMFIRITVRTIVDI